MKPIVTTMACAGAMALAAPANARAEAVLRYERAPSVADACPDESTLRIEVARRLGYDPFVEHPSDGRRIVSTVDRAASGEFHGRVRLEAEDGDNLGERELEAVDCGELVASMALTTSVLLEPLAGRHLRTAPAPPPAGPHETPDEPAPPVPPSPPPPPGWRVRVGAFALGTIASAPAPTVGFKALVGASWALWSLDAEGRFDLPSASTDDSHGATASLVLGGLVPCRHVARVALCVAFWVGALQGQSPGSAPGPHRQSSLFTALGPRLGVELPVTAGASFVAHLDLLGVAAAQPYRWTADGWHPEYTSVSEVRNVSARSAKEVWAMGGTYFRGEGNGATLMRWNGAAWDPPFYVDGGGNYVQDVSFVDDARALAVGIGVEPAGALMAWDGTKWRVLASDSESSYLHVWASSMTDAWIASSSLSGGRGILHWNGVDLRRDDRVPPGSYELWASARDNVWACGQPVLVSGAAATGCLRFDGSTWRPIDTNTDQQVTGVWGTGPNDVWITTTSYYYSEVDFTTPRSYVRHYDGAGFATQLEVPAHLLGASGSGAANVWVVGDQGATLQFHSPRSPAPR